MKRVSIALCLILSLLLCGIGLSMAEEPVDVLSVTAITDTMPEGEKFVALAIEYSEPFAAGAATRASFAVDGREITRVYVNDSGEVGDVQYTGSFVMVELTTSNTPGASLGTTLYYGKMNGMTVNINHRLPINALITQSANLTAISGNVAQGKRLEITGDVNPLADQFIPLSFTDPDSGMTMNYRLYIPEGYETRSNDLDDLPLVLFLHGSGERGYNNASQLLANPSALEFARPEAQAKHPCFVLAPQNPDATQGWAINIGTREDQEWVTTPQLEAAKKIVDETIAAYNVDTSRIYGTGLSQGSKGTMRLGINYPGLYAAQLNSSGCDAYTDEEIATIAHKPIWHLIAFDDPTNPSENVRVLIEQLKKGGATVVQNIDEQSWNGWLRGADSAALAQAQWDAAIAAGANVLHTEYISGTVVPNAHWSWMANYSNEVVREWLFSQVNPTPYAPE